MNNFNPVEFSSGLWRGSQPQGLDWQVLRHLGIKTIVDINDSALDPIGIEYQFTVHRIPMSSVWPPSKEQVDRAIGYLAGDSRPIFIHCKDGEDRTGFVVARYRQQG